MEINRAILESQQTNTNNGSFREEYKTKAGILMPCSVYPFQ